MEASPAARTIAIGDIHGCDRALTSLLNALKLTKQDRVITLGDYVDRGPGSRQVIERLIQLQDECELIPLRGNHEIMLLTSLDDNSQMRFWLGSGGQQTVDSYGGDLENIPGEHLEFLRGCRPVFEGENYFCVHANYTPAAPLTEQPDFTMYWEHLDTYFPEPHFSGKTAIVGHTPQRGGKVLVTEHLICLDTHCYGGGLLTALDLDTGELWQASPEGKLVQFDEPSPD
jgi:serine/threonine protein phosphatase 1